MTWCGERTLVKFSQRRKTLACFKKKIKNHLLLLVWKDNKELHLYVTTMTKNVRNNAPQSLWIFMARVLLSRPNLNNKMLGNVVYIFILKEKFIKKNARDKSWVKLLRLITTRCFWCWRLFFLRRFLYYCYYYSDSGCFMWENCRRCGILIEFMSFVFSWQKCQFFFYFVVFFFNIIFFGHCDIHIFAKW